MEGVFRTGLVISPKKRGQKVSNNDLRKSLVLKDSQHGGIKLEFYLLLSILNY